jgi:hypothetical protein
MDYPPTPVAPPRLLYGAELATRAIFEKFNVAKRLGIGAPRTAMTA